MSMWFSQKRRVDKMGRQMVQAKSAELAWRGEFSRRAKEAYTRVSTMIWVSITGAIWVSRMRHQEEDEGENPVVAGLAAAWIAQRWRRLPGKLYSAYVGAKEPEQPEPSLGSGRVRDERPPADVRLPPASEPG